MIREINHNLVTQSDQTPLLRPFHLEGGGPGDGRDVESASALLPLPPLPPLKLVSLKFCRPALGDDTLGGKGGSKGGKGK